ncbi:hypothetical protein ACFSQD_17640 [Flavihumibacter stibioxidans]|uniref:Glycosyltransferase RgtA/B/C/D-like domain-containing protein n=1 Tax=Flavihumibacter stibioxidans TaxID=1834163 RepID=A0ABR7MCI8_9BACT|nr:hypothetical protein [Flavihumibacter stibioxidans]MBC6492753.1 hypothetical protein [Flavihumibacter stibioxidans]
MAQVNSWKSTGREAPAFSVFNSMVACYSVAGLLMFYLVCCHINPDGIAYLTIAKNYANGNWHAAINAYWSPLLSWILSPFSFIPVELLFFYYALNFFLGLAGLFVFRQLMRQLEFGKPVQVLLIPVFTGFMLLFAFRFMTPDLMVVVLLLMFLRFWLKTDALDRPLITSLWLLVLYFAKPYNFIFGAGLLAYDLLARFRQKKGSKAFQNFLLIFVYFLLLASPWLIAIHWKYGEWMLSGAGGFNHGAALVNLGFLGLDIPGMESIKDSYAFMFRFGVQPHEYSVFAWEDPVLMADYNDYNILGSVDNFLLQLRVIWVNFRYLLSFKDVLLSISFAGLLLAGLKAILYGKKQFRNGGWAAIRLNDIPYRLFFFGSLYLLGYMLLFLENRYLWINLIVGLIAAGLLIEDYFGQAQARASGKSTLKWWFMIGLVLGAVSFYTFLFRTFSVMLEKMEPAGYKEYALGREIKSLVKQENRIAAHWPYVREYSLFSSWFTTYFAGGKHFNCLPDDEDAANNLINKHRINIVFVPEGKPLPGNLVVSKWVKLDDAIPEMDVYLRPQ